MATDDGYYLSDIVASYRQRAELPSYVLAVDWFEQTLRALATMHAAGKVHGAIGLETIFVDGDHNIQLNDPRMTSATQPLLTGPSWDRSGGPGADRVAAEMVADLRVDLYGVGAAFYELLTNQTPGQSPGSSPLPPSSINNTVPKGFDAVILRLLSTPPGHCYASAMDALVDLAVLRRSPQVIPIPVLVKRVGGSSGASSASEGVPRVAMIAAGAIIGAVGGAVIGFFMHSFLPVTCIVGAMVGGVVGVFANPNV